MQLYAESGTEYLLPYAKTKLAQWKAQMARAGGGSFAKRIDVDNGSVIYINSAALGHGRYNDRIRITGGYQYTFGTLSDPGLPYARYLNTSYTTSTGPVFRTDLYGHASYAHSRYIVP